MASYEQYRKALLEKVGVEMNIAQIAKATNHGKDYIKEKIWHLPFKRVGHQKMYAVDDVAAALCEFNELNHE